MAHLQGKGLMTWDLFLQGGIPAGEVLIWIPSKKGYNDSSTTNLADTSGSEFQENNLTIIRINKCRS